MNSKRPFPLRDAPVQCGASTKPDYNLYVQTLLDLIGKISNEMGPNHERVGQLLAQLNKVLDTQQTERDRAFAEVLEADRLRCEEEMQLNEDAAQKLQDENVARKLHDAENAYVPKPLAQNDEDANDEFTPVGPRRHRSQHK
jgi:hypothetical protein